MNVENKELLPAWFTKRMMSDSWAFGLLLSTGHTLYIERISNIVVAIDGNLWIDVVMKDGRPISDFGDKLLISPTSRTTASINAFHVVAAVELADT